MRISSILYTMWTDESVTIRFSSTAFQKWSFGSYIVLKCCLPVSLNLHHRDHTDEGLVLGVNGLELHALSGNR
jgi:hypothetical protein